MARIRQPPPQLGLAHDIHTVVLSRVAYVHGKSFSNLPKRLVVRQGRRLEQHEYLQPREEYCPKIPLPSTSTRLSPPCA